MATSSNTVNSINFDPLTWDSLRNELKNSENDEIWLKTIDEQIVKVSTEQSKRANKIKDYMKWIDARKKNIKSTNAPIPSSVLGSNIVQADLIDIRISCRGPDDKLYDRDEQLRKRLPRGCTLIEYKIKGETTMNSDFAIFALRKFSGGLGDDDDREENNQAWLQYFLADPSTASRIVSTRKVNGEACHLSCIMLPPNNRMILVAGSKNVHLAFRTHNDLDRYSDGGIYSYAKPFCRLILDTLANMPDGGRKLIHFLALTRYTAVFEALSYHHQHVVNLSYLKDEPHSSALTFLTFSEVPDDFDGRVVSLCSLRPDYSINLAKRLHLLTTDYEIIENEPKVLNDYLRSIKYRPDCEGSVLYFIDDKDRVIGLLKKKTIWYVILRAIREKVRYMLSEWEKKHKLDQKDVQRRVDGRLKAIQRWLGFSDEIHTRWENLAHRFLDWIWAEFLEETKSRDDFMFEISPSNEEIWTTLNQPIVDDRTTTDSAPVDVKNEDEDDDDDDVVE